jgi:hypothetical protein
MKAGEKDQDNLAAMSEVSVVTKINMSEFEIAFDDLAVKTSIIALHWLKAMIRLDVKPVQDFWVQISPELLTDRLREVAVRTSSEMIKLIEPEDTEDYLKLFLIAHKNGDNAAQYIHPDYRTTATVEAMIESTPFFEKTYKANPWVAAVMTPELVEKASQKYIMFMCDLPRVKISQAALKAHLEKDFNGYLKMRGAKKLKLAAEYLKEEGWPESVGIFKGGQAMPRSTLEGFERLSENVLNAQVFALHMAWLINQPMDEVLELMGNRRYAHLIIEMYTLEELMPFMKNHYKLKGLLLEDSLGL